MPVKFGQTSIRFWFFLSYLITTVTKRWVDGFERQRLLFLTNCTNFLIFRGQQAKKQAYKISSLPFYKYFSPTVQREPLLVLLPGNLLWLRGIELQTCYEGQHSVLQQQGGSSAVVCSVLLCALCYTIRERPTLQASYCCTSTAILTQWP